MLGLICETSVLSKHSRENRDDSNITDTFWLQQAMHATSNIAANSFPGCQEISIIQWEPNFIVILLTRDSHLSVSWARASQSTASILFREIPL